MSMYEITVAIIVIVVTVGAVLISIYAMKLCAPYRPTHKRATKVAMKHLEAVRTRNEEATLFKIDPDADDWDQCPFWTMESQCKDDCPVCKGSGIIMTINK